MVEQEQLEQLIQKLNLAEQKLNHLEGLNAMESLSKGLTPLETLLYSRMLNNQLENNTEQQDKQLDNNMLHPMDMLKTLIIIKAVNGQLDDNIEQQIERAEKIIQRLEKLSLKMYLKNQLIELSLGMLLLKAMGYDKYNIEQLMDDIEQQMGETIEKINKIIQKIEG